MITDFHRYAERTRSMVRTVGERYDLDVRMNSQGAARTDTHRVHVLSPEYFLKYGMSRKEAENLAIYVAGHEGAHTRISNIKVLTEKFARMLNKGYDETRLNHLLQITEDVRVDYDTIHHRPGFKDIRHKADRSLLKVGYTQPKNDDDFNLVMAISCLTYDADMRKLNYATGVANPWKTANIDWDKAIKATEMIMQIAKMKDTTSETSLKIARKVYHMLWGKPGAQQQGGQGDDGQAQENVVVAEVIKQEDENETDEQITVTIPDSCDNDEPENSEADEADENTDTDINTDSTNDGDNEEDSQEEDDTDGSADGDSDEAVDDEEDDDTADSGDYDDADMRAAIKALASIDSAPMAMMNDSLKQMFEEAIKEAAKRQADDIVRMRDMNNRARTYGEKVLTPDQDTQMMNVVSAGAHAGVAVAYVKNTFKGDYTTLDTYKKYYGPHRAECEGHAKALARKLIQDLRAAKDPEGYVSDNGTVIASKAWRPGVTGDSHVFNKNSYDESGDYVIDVLLDASGSQMMRKGMVSAQGFILAEAITMAGLPVQVCTFNRQGISTVVTQLRDYDDPREKNQDIFLYATHGDNRDGHALRTVEWSIKNRRPEQNKIIIMLSDGMPNDTTAGQAPYARQCGAMAIYDYDIADPDWRITGLDDMAINVRRIRAEGIAVLGVYTGNAEKKKELEQEKLMFGSDFAFLPDMNDFAAVVGNYLHRQITKF